jgi:hypothetical protein
MAAERIMQHLWKTTDEKLCCGVCIFFYETNCGVGLAFCLLVSISKKKKMSRGKGIAQLVPGAPGEAPRTRTWLKTGRMFRRWRKVAVRTDLEQGAGCKSQVWNSLVHIARLDRELDEACRIKRKRVLDWVVCWGTPAKQLISLSYEWLERVLLVDNKLKGKDGWERELAVEGAEGADKKKEITGRKRLTCYAADWH